MPLTRRNKQRSGYSFPRPNAKPSGLSLLPAFEQAYGNDLQQKTASLRRNSRALAQQGPGSGTNVGAMRELAQPRDPFYNLARERAISAATAAKDPWSGVNVQQGYDAMARLGIMPGSQKLAAIAGAESPGDLSGQLRALEPMVRQQLGEFNPIRPEETRPDYGTRVGEEYGLDPETGQALRTFYPPSEADAGLKAKYLQGREKTEKERRERRIFNAMAGTPAWHQERMAEAVERARQMARQEQLTDMIASRYAAAGAAGSVGGALPARDSFDEALMGAWSQGAGAPGGAIQAGERPANPFTSNMPPMLLEAATAEDAYDRFPGNENRDKFVAYLVDQGYEPADVEQMADKYYFSTLAGGFARGVGSGIRDMFGLGRRPTGGRRTSTARSTPAGYVEPKRKPPTILGFPRF